MKVYEINFGMEHTIAIPYGHISYVELDRKNSRCIINTKHQQRVIVHSRDFLAVYNDVVKILREYHPLTEALAN